jgi:hypothetical protein
VTCLPRLEPPLFSVPFALAAFRFRSAQCLVHETPLTPPVPPRVAGFFMGHPLSGQRLSAGKVAQCAGLAVLDRPQQAQDKHGKECRGKQPEFCRLSMVDSLLPTASFNRH